MAGERSYVRLDENGVLRVGNTRVMLDSVIAAYQLGHSPETICQQYPSLSPEEVYGAITYYLAHRDDVEEYLKRQDVVWQHWQAVGEQRTDSLDEQFRAVWRAQAPEVL